MLTGAVITALGSENVKSQSTGPILTKCSPVSSPEIATRSSRNAALAVLEAEDSKPSRAFKVSSASSFVADCSDTCRSIALIESRVVLR